MEHKANDKIKIQDNQQYKNKKQKKSKNKKDTGISELQNYANSHEIFSQFDTKNKQPIKIFKILGQKLMN